MAHQAPEWMLVQVKQGDTWTDYTPRPATGFENPTVHRFKASALFAEAERLHGEARVVRPEWTWLWNEAVWRYSATDDVLWATDPACYDATPEPGAASEFRAWQRHPTDWGRR